MEFHVGFIRELFTSPYPLQVAVVPDVDAHQATPCVSGQRKGVVGNGGGCARPVGRREERKHAFADSAG